jgi:integrase
VHVHIHELDSAGVSQAATAKAYRLLRAVLMTATEDRIIARNPCRIRGGGDEKPPERPVLTIAQVLDLAGHMTSRRYRALILLAPFASLRWGEAIALRRCDLDPGDPHGQHPPQLTVLGRASASARIRVRCCTSRCTPPAGPQQSRETRVPSARLISMERFPWVRPTALPDR